MISPLNDDDDDDDDETVVFISSHSCLSTYYASFVDGQSHPCCLYWPYWPNPPNLRFCFINNSSAHDFITRTLLIAEPPALMTSFVQSSTQKKYNISRAEAV